MARTRRTTSGHRLSLFTPGRAGLVVLVLAAAWVGSSFARELYLSYRLNAQVNELHHQNDLIAQANQEYQQQLNALSKPSGAEEQARLHNYIKPDERVFVITPSPTPAAAPSARAAMPKAAAPKSDGGGFWGSLWRAITGGGGG
jgi:cell division protein FtsB